MRLYKIQELEIQEEIKLKEKIVYISFPKRFSRLPLKVIYAFEEIVSLRKHIK